jgi:hypothetical protein
MDKKKGIRLAGFAGALCASAALVSLSVSGTGAYFTDSHGGSLSASSGHLTLDLNPAALNLNYSNLMPGQNVDKTINYNVGVSSGGVDVWLTFDHDSVGYQQFTGGKHSPGWADGGLGRYGYFKVSDSNGGTAFRTGNLSFDDYSVSSNNPRPGDCSTDANGRGGNDWIATQSDSHPTQYCGVPSAILLASNLQNADGGTVTVTFGLNGFLQTEQNQAEPGPLQFKLVATQHGISPND